MCGWDQKKNQKIDCGKCNCSISSAQHKPATDEKTGLRYCTVCDEYC
jgi:hypothetical protein